MNDTADLHALQAAFLAAIYGEGEGAIGHIRGAGLAPAARQDIYRHASELIHLGALATSYPAVRALVGEAYFERVAMDYRHAFPSRRGNLQDFGDAFPGFLAGRPETARWPYLGDVARLEWLRQSCALAADAIALDAATIATAVAMAGEDVVLHLHPSLRLISSRYPTGAIWRFAMSGGEGERPAPDGPGERMALWREGADVVIATHTPASFAFLQALAIGQPLSRAHARAMAIDPGFDLVAGVAGLVHDGRIVRLEPLEAADGPQSPPARC